MRRAFILLNGLFLLLPVWGQEIELLLPDTSYHVGSMDEAHTVLSSRLAHVGSTGQLGIMYSLREIQFHPAEDELALLFFMEHRQVPDADTLLAWSSGGVWLPHLVPFLDHSRVSRGDILHSDGIPAWRVSDKSYFRHGSGYGVLYDLIDVAQRTLQVMIAYDQAQGVRQGKWVGEVSLDLPNIMGSLRHLQVHWRRLSAVTQNFNIVYAEPHLPLLPLGARIAVHQDLRDTLYVQRELKLQFTSLPGYRWSTALGVGFRNLTATRHGKEEGIVPYRHQNINLTLKRHTFDHPVNPRRGFLIEATIEGGTLRGEVVHARAALGRGALHLEGVRSWDQLTIAENIQALGVAAFRYKPQVADYVRLGGSATLRGYREDQFLVPWGLISRSELRYRTGVDSRIHLFLDFGSLADEPVQLSGGLGIVLRAGRNLIQFDLAWNHQDTIRSGKVHFRLFNFLSAVEGGQR